MPLPERVLIDTSAFYAMLSTADEFHKAAKQAYERLVDREQELWTTSYVLVESIALANRRLGFAPLNTFFDRLRPFVQILWVDSRIHNEAWRQFSENEGRGLSFVDLTTAVAASQMRAHVFTFDSGFAKQGIPAVPK